MWDYISEISRLDKKVASAVVSVCELVYKPEARVDLTAGWSITIKLLFTK